jgi:hypothetical protein
MLISVPLVEAGRQSVLPLLVQKLGQHLEHRAFARSDDGREHQENDDKNPAHARAYPPQAPKFNIEREGTPIVSDFIGSAVVSTAAVGVPPRESSAQDLPTILVSSQAGRQAFPIEFGRGMDQ